MKTARVSFHKLSAPILGAIVCALLAPGCNQQAKQALRLDMEPGRMYMLSIRTVSDSKSTMSDGSTNELKGRSEFRLALKAEDTTAEGDTIMSVDPQKAVFPWFYGRINRAFEGKTFKMKVTPTGRISGFVGTDEMRQAVREALEAAPEPKNHVEFSPDTLLQVISDESLTAIFQPILAVWPNVPVTAGDEWTRDDIYNPLSDSLERTTFKMESMEGGTATISMTSTIASAGKDANKNISGTSTGELRVLTADGTIRAYRSSQTIEGTSVNPMTSANDSFTSTAETQAELTAR